jgi:hypothetical protein
MITPAIPQDIVNLIWRDEYPNAADFQPVTAEGAGTVIGWTFRVGRRYGWVIPSGTYAKGLESYRSYAARVVPIALADEQPRTRAAAPTTPAMQPDDVPTEVTKLVYTCPMSASRGYSQNEVAAMLAHYWPAIEAHIRAQIADEVQGLQTRVAELEEDSAVLSALRAGGVDNWGGYSDALSGIEN